MIIDYLPLAKGPQICKKCLHSCKGQQYTTKLDPTVPAIALQKGTGEIRRKGFEYRSIVYDKVLLDRQWWFLK